MHAVEHGMRIGDRQHGMLGGDATHDRARLPAVRGQHEGGELAQPTLDGLLPAALVDLTLESGTDAFQDPGVCGDHERSAGIVLELGQDVRRDPGRVDRLVGQDGDLARAVEAVDPDGAEELPLRFLHVDAAGPGDEVHGGDCLGPAGQGGHGVAPADAVHLADAQQLRGGQHAVVDAALRGAPVGVGRRRGQADALDACHLRRHGQHDQRRRIGGPPAGDQQARRAHRLDAQSQSGSIDFGRRRRGGRDVLLVAPHVVDRALHGRAQLRRDAIRRGPQRVRRHAQHRCVEPRIAEPAHVRDQGRVTVTTYVGNESGDRLAQLRVAADRPRQPLQERLQLAPIVRIGVDERA